MDREKEAAEQAKLDASNLRRVKRALLRDYIQAHIEQRVGVDGFTEATILLRIINCRMILRQMGFRRFGVLRTYALKQASRYQQH